MRQTPTLTFRMIDAVSDARLAFAHYRDAAAATYGPLGRKALADRYLPWLKSRVEEFPDGHVLAFLGERCVGQLELQIPYGLSTGYVNLFYVTRDFRRQGFGRLLHGYAESYFKSWEGTRIELDVSPENLDAIGFYRAMGYRFVQTPAAAPELRRMARNVTVASFSRRPVQPPVPPATP